MIRVETYTVTQKELPHGLEEWQVALQRFLNDLLDGTEYPRRILGWVKEEKLGLPLGKTNYTITFEDIIEPEKKIRVEMIVIDLRSDKIVGGLLPMEAQLQAALDNMFGSNPPRNRRLISVSEPIHASQSGAMFRVVFEEDVSPNSQ